MGSVAFSEDEILAAISCEAFGTAQSMREHERKFGFVPVNPGEVPWLPADEWPNDVVISLDGHRVRIVFIYTLNTGNGAFSRLVTEIIRAELIPTVIAPLGEMTDILTAWKWHHRIVGTTFDNRWDEWFPTKKWRMARLQEHPAGEST